MPVRFLTPDFSAILVTVFKLSPEIILILTLLS